MLPRHFGLMPLIIEIHNPLKNFFHPVRTFVLNLV
jgi:hypothetical protein